MANCGIRGAEQLARREFITEADAAQMEIEPGSPVIWRGAENVSTKPIVELAGAIVSLVRGTLPHAPRGTCRYIGSRRGWCTIAMQDDACG